jgi:hypothetical protein
MKNSLAKTGAVIALAGALALSSATPTFARNWGRTAAAAGIGFAAGTILGSAVANSNRVYYGAPYAYDPYYGGGYVYDRSYDYVEPAYAYEVSPRYRAADVYAYEPAPAARTGSCWHATDDSRPYGYFHAC